MEHGPQHAHCTLQELAHIPNPHQQGPECGTVFGHMTMSFQQKKGKERNGGAEVWIRK